MEVSVVWKDGKYPSFNLSLATKAGADPFMEIKGCKLIDGQKGVFVSYPSRKQDDGKYWNHVWASDAFNKVVIQKAQEASKPKSKSLEDLENDVPF